MQSRRARIFQRFPDPVIGYKLSPEHGYFSVIIPEATTNLVANPSVEFGTTTNYAAYIGAMASTYSWQAYGAAGLQLTPAVGAESGFAYGTVALTINVTYTASITIQGEAGKIYYIWFADGGGALLGTKRKWIGTGHKQRIWVTYTETASNARGVFVTRDGQYTDQNLWYADGLQVEAKSYPTTYCDGSLQGFVIGQVAYTWTGTPNLSTSTRSAQTRTGGREMSLLNLGLRVLAILGLGMAPLVDQALAIPGLGELAQGTGTRAREFSLVGALYDSGPDGRGLQAIRDDLIDAVKPDLVTYDQPLILRYQACDEDGDPISDSLDIICKYTGGLEGNWDNHQQERIVLNFKQHLPYIRNTYDSGVELGYQTEITNANYGVMREADGTWNRISASLNDFIYFITKGLYGWNFIVGTFINVGDANGDNIIQLQATDGALGPSLGTGLNNGARAMAFLPNGNLYVGGWFTSAGGVGGTARIALWDGSNWFSVAGGIANGIVYSIVHDPANNCLYIGGSFTNHGDANGDYITRFDLDLLTYSSLGTGANDFVYTLAIGPDGYLYAGGRFTSMGGVAGTNGLARWNGITWGPVGGGVEDSVQAIAFGLDGSLYVSGDFLWAVASNGLPVNGTALIARWNGTSWLSVGGGAIGTSIWTLQVTSDGILHAGGNFTSIGGMQVPDSAGYWNGSIWLPIDINLPGDAIITSMLVDEQFGRTYVGYTTAGSAYSAIVAISIVGSSTAYPIFTITGPGILWQIKNNTTGKVLLFDLTLVDGEGAVLCLDPQHPYFVSSFRGNIWNTILPGSNLNFELLPGTNSISAFIFGGTTAATTIFMQWRDQYWSLDGAVWK